MRLLRGLFYASLTSALTWLQRALDLPPVPTPTPVPQRAREPTWTVVYDRWDEDWCEFIRADTKDEAHEVAMALCALFARMNEDVRVLVMPVDQLGHARRSPAPQHTWN